MGASWGLVAWRANTRPACSLSRHLVQASRRRIIHNASFSARPAGLVSKILFRKHGTPRSKVKGLAIGMCITLLLSGYLEVSNSGVTRYFRCRSLFNAHIAVRHAGLDPRLRPNKLPLNMPRPHPTSQRQFWRCRFSRAVRCLVILPRALLLIHGRSLRRD